MNPKVTLVAAPLITKGGVFRSTCELVEAARNAGLDWKGVIVTRGDLGATSVPEGVDVHVLDYAGLTGLLKLRSLLGKHERLQSSDAVISLIPQSDVLLATLKRHRKQKLIAYVRGAPWPREGEANHLRRTAWRLIERWALSRMWEVWATTPKLKEELDWPQTHIVPAGIASHAQARVRKSTGSVLVWAARMSPDKNPHLFLEILKQVPVTGLMFGDGELRSELEQAAPSNVMFRGWSDPQSVWEEGTIYIGTSFREAFGRSAVEAATGGMATVLSDAFGAAPMLYTDKQLRDAYVLDPHDTQAWVVAVQNLVRNDSLRAEVGNHVRQNAQALSIQGSVAAIVERIDHRGSRAA